MSERWEPMVLNHAQLQTIAKLDYGYGVRLDLYESEEGGEIRVHVLMKYGYTIEFVRMDGSLVGHEGRFTRAVGT